jgi:NAD(P)H-quinone oxidoreductase subunit 5
VVAAAALAWGFSPATEPALWAMGGILTLALVPLLTGPLLRAGTMGALAGLGAAFVVALGYFGLHAMFSGWLVGSGAGTLPNPGLVGWVLGCFGLLFLVQGAVRARPHGALARWLYPRLFAGLYLDELFTRLTFRLWPARVPAMPGTLARPAAVLPDAQTQP